MCQIEKINEMDTTNIFEKTIERMLFLFRNPLTYASILVKKTKRFNRKSLEETKKQDKRFSGSDTITNSIKPVSPNLKEGDIVRIRSKEQIQETLDKNNKLAGCLFMEQMWQYCGTEHRIVKKVDYFYDEANRRMCKARNTVLLEGVYCSGKFERYPRSCDRCCLLFWREEWLEKPNNKTS